MLFQVTPNIPKLPTNGKTLLVRSSECFYGNGVTVILDGLTGAWQFSSQHVRQRERLNSPLRCPGQRKVSKITTLSKYFRRDIFWGLCTIRIGAKNTISLFLGIVFPPADEGCPHSYSAYNGSSRYYCYPVMAAILHVKQTLLGYKMWIAPDRAPGRWHYLCGTGTYRIGSWNIRGSRRTSRKYFPLLRVWTGKADLFTRVHWELCCLFIDGGEFSVDPSVHKGLWLLSSSISLFIKYW